ncbi:hypothetical protein ABVK25_005031 [Lepraria finkii]|uniref:Uncharacterized protein n=1 Tax=Lepraria finkii TaxID=1340010 RepID=A0ABR4BA39_9LECA
MLDKLRIVREDLFVHLLVVMSNRQMSDKDALLSDNKQVEKPIIEAIEDSKSQDGAQMAELSAQLKRKSPKERQQLVDGCWISRNLETAMRQSPKHTQQPSIRSSMPILINPCHG